MTSAAEQTVHRWLVRAEGTALAFACLATAVVVMTGFWTGGWADARSALLGAGDVMVFFALGVYVDVVAVRNLQAAGIVVVLGGYGARIALLTGTAFLLAQTPWLTSAIWFGAGASATVLAWTVGLVVGHVSGRWPVYDLAGVTA